MKPSNEKTSENYFTPGFFRRLQQLRIHTRKSYLGSRQGVHQSNRKGHGLEFADFRQYSPGDDFRHIDWGIYGRSDRLYVRQFREEQDLNIVILLDTSASMKYPEQKFEMAKRLAVSLGYVAMSDGDAVCFGFLGQRNSQKYRGPQLLGKAQQEVMQVEAGGDFDFVTEVKKSLDRQKLPGKCFLISDFLFEFDTQIHALDSIRGRSFDVSIIQVLAPSELSLTFNAGSTFVRDAETGAEEELALSPASKKEYAALLSSHIEKLERYSDKLGIAHLLVSSEEKVEDVVLNRFPAVGILK